MATSVSRSSAALASQAMQAIQESDLKTMRRLINVDDRLVNYSALDPQNEQRQLTLLQAAARKGDLAVAELLIEAGCRVNAVQDATGDTALIMALRAGHESVAEAIIRHEKCDYGVQNAAGYTALMTAAEAGLVDSAELLLMRNADLECETVEDGCTALALAVATAQVETVRLLLEYGADASHRTAGGGGRSPVELAWDLPDSDPDKRAICEAFAQRPKRRHQRARARARADSPDEDDFAATNHATSNSSMRGSVGLIGGRYRNLRQLGRGAQGLALLVRDMRCDCSGRLRVLKKIRGGGVEHVEGLNREIDLLKRLNHSCLLTLLDYFNENDSVCLVTEYCGLRDLHTWIRWAYKTDIALPSRLVTHWLLQMLLGLSYLHERRVIHRDFKPSNVFVKADATVRIGDFGCSLQLQASRRQAHSFRGTWNYMSPEMLKNEPYGTQTDMWSLGCTLYELCTGRALFGGAAAATAASFSSSSSSAAADNNDADMNVRRAQLASQICQASDAPQQRLPSLPSASQQPLLPDWLREAFPHLMSKASQRPGAATLLRESEASRSLAEMTPPKLAEDREFLRDNRQGVLLDSDDETEEDAQRSRRGKAGRHNGGASGGADFSQAYDALLADALAFAEAKDRLDEEASNMEQLEALRARLAEKQQRQGFPLDRVYQALLTEPGTAGLDRLTNDSEGCELVQLAIMLEQQLCPNSMHTAAAGFTDNGAAN